MPREETYFLPYQSRWIRDESRLKIVEKSRQIGLSYADSYDSVRKAGVKGGRDVWVMSRDETQAKQYIRYCVRWATILKYAAADHGEEIVNDTNGKQITVQVLRFASGAAIYALSSNPDAIVGKTGHVKLDEFALHKDQRTLYAVAKPVIQWGGTLSIISTHRGVGTEFNRLIQDIKLHGNPMGWSLHTIPIQLAVEEGIVERIDRATGGRITADWEKSKVQSPESKVESPKSLREFWLAQQRAECIDEEQWSQEYCCIPADESTAFLAYDLIRGCQVEDTLRGWDYAGACQNALYLGVDVARKKDLCVLDLGEKVGDVVWDRMRLELAKQRFSAIEAELYRLLGLPMLRRACLDATGMGMQLAERAIERFSWRVEAVTFTGTVKEALAFPLKQGFEDRRLRIDSSEKLQADLHGIKKETTAAGNIRFVGDTDDSHCDRFWAKALRQHAAQSPLGVVTDPNAVRMGASRAGPRAQVGRWFARMVQTSLGGQ